MKNLTISSTNALDNGAPNSRTGSTVIPFPAQGQPSNDRAEDIRRAADELDARARFVRRLANSNWCYEQRALGVVLTSNISDSAKALFALRQYFADFGTGGNCRPDKRTLACLLGKKERQIKNLDKELRDAGFAASRRRFQEAAVYTLIAPDEVNRIISELIQEGQNIALLEVEEGQEIASLDAEEGQFSDIKKGKKLPPTSSIRPLPKKEEEEDARALREGGLQEGGRRISEPLRPRFAVLMARWGLGAAQHSSIDPAETCKDLDQLITRRSADKDPAIVLAALEAALIKADAIQAEHVQTGCRIRHSGPAAFTNFFDAVLADCLERAERQASGDKRRPENPYQQNQSEIIQAAIAAGADRRIIEVLGPVILQRKWPRCTPADKVEFLRQLTHALADILDLNDDLLELAATEILMHCEWRPEPATVRRALLNLAAGREADWDGTKAKQEARRKAELEEFQEMLEGAR